MNLSHRMNVAIEYIEKNLNSPLPLEEVAKQAYCSKYHFHRVFFANFNITCAEYIRRRKLTVAAAELINTNNSIVDIAFKFGYESPNAFTRAFRNVHGINPSKARKNGHSLASYKKVFFTIENEAENSMNYRIITVPEFNIIGSSQQFEFDNFAKEGPKFWKEYVNSDNYNALYQLNNGQPRAITNAALLSAYFPTEQGKRDEFIDVLGIEATDGDDSSQFETHTVPTATYAEFECTYKTSMKTNRYIYGEWFAATGYERDGNKPDIVAYFPIPFKPMSEMRLRWWIPITRKQ